MKMSMASCSFLYSPYLYIRAPLLSPALTYADHASESLPVGAMIIPMLQMETPGAGRLSNFLTWVKEWRLNLNPCHFILESSVFSHVQCEANHLVWEERLHFIFKFYFFSFVVLFFLRRHRLHSVDRTRGGKGKRGREIVQRQVQIEQAVIAACAWQQAGKHHPFPYTPQTGLGSGRQTPHRCSRRKPFNFYRERYFQEFTKSAIQIMKPKW